MDDTQILLYPLVGLSSIGANMLKTKYVFSYIMVKASGLRQLQNGLFCVEVR